MQELIMSRIHDLVLEYNQKLLSKGIQCSVSRKYFETQVDTRSHSTNAGLLDIIDHFLDERREKKYKNQNNRYHTVILTVSPADRSAVKPTQCKQYAFLMRKTERPHIGDAPEQRTYRPEKIVSNIEKRLQKILKQAETQSVDKVCKEALPDLLRYMFGRQYGYKKTILGKDRYVWDLLISGIVVLMAVLFLLICAL